MTGKIVGFRAWTLDGYKLLSANPHLKGYWKIGVNKAECRFHLFQGSMHLPVGTKCEHDAPDPDCQCGLYAWHTPEHIGAADGVFGAVTAWGRVQVHADGFRAEYAEPVVLAYKPQQPYESVKRAEAIASEMGVPFVTVDELPAEAAKHGSPVAKDLRPETSARHRMIQAAQGQYYTYSSSGSAFSTGGLVGASGWPPYFTPVVSSPATRKVRDTGTKVRAGVNLALLAIFYALFVIGLEPWYAMPPITAVSGGCAAWIWWGIPVWREVPK